MYCTYLTTYLGNKLPPFYIGSSSVKNVNNGYHGSVKSKRYKKIWNEELLNNPDFFKTKILTQHELREDAIKKERKLQINLNVVKNILYINQAIAAPNGYFGRDTSGEKNPMYGIHLIRKEHSEESKLKMSIKASKRRKNKTYEELTSPENAAHWRAAKARNMIDNNPNKGKFGELHHSFKKIWITDGLKNFFIQPDTFSLYPKFRIGRTTSWSTKKSITPKS